MEAPVREPDRSPAPSADSKRRISWNWEWRREIYYGLLVLGLVAMGVVAWIAPRQQVHPDALRSVQPWDVARADWWLYPRELNAFRRNVVAGGLTAVYALPGGKHIWVAGEKGLILHSADGGGSWEQQLPKLAASANKEEAGRAQSLLEALIPSAHAAEKVDQKYSANPAAQVASPKGGLPNSLAASAVGQPLQQQQLPQQVPASASAPTPASTPASSARAAAPKVLTARAEIAELRAIHFADEKFGWAAGGDGDYGAVILQTSDGGNTWRRVDLPAEQQTLLSIAVDGQTVWAVGINGTTVTSEDGGASWTAMDVEGAFWDQVLISPASKTVWLGGTDPRAKHPVIWSKTPKEKKGQLARTLPTSESFSLAVHPQTGRLWLATGSGRLYESTSDDLKDWREQDAAAAKSDQPVEYARLSFNTRGDQAFVLGAGRLWSLSLPSGTAWKPGPGAAINATSFFVGDDATWAVGDGSIWKGGAEGWQLETLGPDEVLTSVAFSQDGERGWALGLEGLVLATRDGGAVWVPSKGARIGKTCAELHLASEAPLRLVARCGSASFESANGADWKEAPGAAAGAYAVVSNALPALAAAPNAQRMLRFQGVGPSYFDEPSTALARRSKAQLSDDGGKTWSAISLGADSGAVSAAAILDDGRAWLATFTGEIFFRRAPELAALEQPVAKRLPIFDLKMNADGLRGWAAGARGHVIATIDGGKSWTAQDEIKTAHHLWSIAANADGQHLWVAGSGATLRASADGGRTWAESGVYDRDWAPWAYAALVALSTLLAAMVLRVRPVGVVMGRDPERSEGASTTLANDQPIVDKQFDLLGYKDAVEALSSFIRNDGTEPRVTIAVSGEWGSGKSSIMRMLETELERAGFRTAWYNAWHQQQEGRPLTALFNTIREQAVPRWFKQPLAALRVRSRLIWGRGGIYRAVSVVVALGLAVLLGDLLRESTQSASQRIAANFRHHVLGQRTLVIDAVSLAALNPFAKAVPEAQGSGVKLNEVISACAASDKAKLVSNPPLIPTHFCDLALMLVPTSEWQSTNASVICRVKPAANTQTQSQQDLACQFGGAEALEQVLIKRLSFTKAEAAAVVKAAQVQEPPPLFSWLHGSIASGFAGLVLLIFTKGISVYGLQLLAPLKQVLGSKMGEEGSKESAGTVEKYRKEFCLLSNALDGRLVVFIDDLDRCSPETVNRTLELTNYLVDVGRCFVVVGAAMERVKKCIRPPVYMAKPDSDAGQQEARDYANDYLRKLVHVELPVPSRQQMLTRLLEPRIERQQQSQQRAREQLMGRAGFALAVVLLLWAVWAAMGVGARLHDRGAGDAPQVDAAPSVLAGAVTAVDAASGAVAKDTPSGTTERRSTSSPLDLQGDVRLDAPTGKNASPDDAWYVAVLCAAVVAAALAWKRLRRYRDAISVALGGALREHDSARFLNALRLWGPMVIAHDPTPRQVKRFYNRARLLAAFEAGSSGVDEVQLVALAAADQASPELFKFMDDYRIETDAELSAVLKGEFSASTMPESEKQLWQAHIQAAGRPPTMEEVQRFRQRVAGLEVR